jgi:hypothetical protein
MDVWKFSLAFYCIFSVEICDFGIFSFPWKFKLTSENSKLVNPRKVKPFVVRQISIGKGVGSVALESEGLQVQRGIKFWEL